MNHTKIQFLPDELRLVADERIILTKTRIIKKISLFFESLLDAYSIEYGHVLHQLEIPPHSKISKGENYCGLPYVILDYPKYFTKHDIFAVRTMFWWGNDFSLTLHLKGKYKTLFGGMLIKNLEKLKQPGWYVQVSDNEWQHHHSSDTHRAIAGMDQNDAKTIFEEKPFIKIAYYFPLLQWEKADQLLRGSFFSIMHALER